MILVEHAPFDDVSRIHFLQYFHIIFSKELLVLLILHFFSVICQMTFFFTASGSDILSTFALSSSFGRSGGLSWYVVLLMIVELFEQLFLLLLLFFSLFSRESIEAIFLKVALQCFLLEF